MHRVLSAVLAAGLVGACSRATEAPVEPLSLADATPQSSADAQQEAADVTSPAADTKITLPTAGAYGGLWVVDSAGQPIGVLVQRGHPSLSSGSGTDILRDGVLVFSPQTGLFFGVQLSTGKVINPRLGVKDQGCGEPVVAGYYTEGDAVSGPPYAFVYNGFWYRVEQYQPLALVTCGGTVADGIDGKCAPHSGSCRGFPVKQISVGLPLQFPAPMQVAWVSK